MTVFYRISRTQVLELVFQIIKIEQIVSLRPIIERVCGGSIQINKPGYFFRMPRSYRAQLFSDD
jgi:hypothetical protein